MKYLLLLLLSFNVYGAELIIEQGESTVWFADTKTYTPASYGAAALRFAVPNTDRFVEVIQGGWEGVNNSRFIGLSLGYRSPGKYFAEYAIGGAYLLEPRTAQLDGNEQFLLTLGVGARFDNLFVAGRLRHISNGNTQGKNHGFEVLVGSVGVVF